MTTSRRSAPARHDDHDRLAIAALAAGDLGGGERTAAERLVVECPACRALRDDLLAVTAATRSLSAVPPGPAPRDFRITAAQAERLRHGAAWRRLLRPFAGGAFPARPIASTFVTLGVAGLLLVGMTNLPFGTTAGGTARNASGQTVAQDAATAASQGAATAGPQYAATAAATGPGSASSTAPEAADGGVHPSPVIGETPVAAPPTAGLRASASPGDAAAASAGPIDLSLSSPGGAGPLLLSLSLAFLGVGAVLLLLGLAARRWR